MDIRHTAANKSIPFFILLSPFYAVEDRKTPRVYPGRFIRECPAFDRVSSLK
jgi:hypothetical protein